MFSSWIDEKRVVLFNGPTLDVSEQTEGNPSPPDYRSRRAGEWSRPRPPSSSLLLLLPPPPSSVVRMIFSCLWPEGFTLTPEPLQFLPGSKWPQRKKKKKNAKGAPETKKSDTSDSNSPWSIHLLHPPPAPPVPNSFRLLWLRAGGFTQCCSLPAAQTDTDQRLKYGSTFLTDKDRWKVSLQYNKQNLMR